MKNLVRHRIASRPSAPVWLAPQQVPMRLRASHRVSIPRHRLATAHVEAQAKLATA